MAGFYLTTGNDQQLLVARMGEQLRSRPLARVLEPERVMVQSLGMQRWISLELAGQLGIAANFRFLFPNQLLEEVFEQVIPGFQKEALFDRETVSWKVMELLPSQLDKADFQELKGYLLEAGDVSPVKTWQLARKIAYLFDQYCMYRPKMIEEWDAGAEAGWQGALWRLLRDNGLETHLPLLRQSFFREIRSPQFNSRVLPERFTVFGITSLPPFHLEILSALSGFSEVYLYFFNPSAEYWGDILSRKEMARRMRRHGDPELTEEMLYMEQGNPLLASLGRTGRSFLDLLLETGFNLAAEDEAFVQPECRSLLQVIQSDIYHLHDPDTDDYPRHGLPETDESVQIHSCHSRMREVEVLQDRLKMIMSDNPSLRPGDILVMAPDINPYAPIIKAVFSPEENSGRHLPYSIADRQYSRESKIIQWFLKLIEIPGSRFNLPDILELLESKAILSRFGIAEADVHLLQDWLVSSNIRWGIDKNHQQSFGTPGIHQNTWEFGLERLLLGLALPDEGQMPFQGVLPFDRIEGSQGVLLGKFMAFFTELKQLARLDSGGSGEQQQKTGAGNGGRRSLKAWSSFLAGIIVRFFPEETDETGDELQVLGRVVTSLGGIADRIQADGDVDFEVVHSYLLEQLGQSGSGFGFLGSGITFCSMLPMRSIPFKVVVLLGMNDQEFPRRNRPPGFDLMAAHPLPGDRSPRDDDRYLFLEAILSAGEILYISYVGQNIRDNSQVPPSIVVSELLRYCEAVAGRCRPDLAAGLVSQQRLQAFSPHYFKPDPGPTGFSEQNLQAARILLQHRLRKPGPFIGRLPEPDAAWQQVELEQLISFFANPCRFLLRERLGVYLEDRSIRVEDAEPFDIGGLEKYQLHGDLLETCLSGQSPEMVQTRFRSAGVLPTDPVGSLVFEVEQHAVQEFAGAVRPLLSGVEEPPLNIDVELEGVRISGSIRGIFPRGVVQFRMARLKTTDLVCGWLNWLFFSLLNGHDTIYGNGYIIGLDDKKRPCCLQAKPVDNPERFLEPLVGLFREGLSRPLPFFPAAAKAYIEALTGKKPETALQKALGAWEGNALFAEREDPYFSKCFGHTNPINSEFTDLCRSILLPVYEHYSKEAG